MTIIIFWLPSWQCFSETDDGTGQVATACVAEYPWGQSSSLKILKIVLPRKKNSLGWNGLGDKEFVKGTVFAVTLAVWDYRCGSATKELESV